VTGDQHSNESPVTHCAALIVAAGEGSRFAAATPKVYADLAGRSILARALAPFLAHDGIDTVQTVTRPDDDAAYATAIADLDTAGKLLPTIAGSRTRRQSVRNGLAALSKLPGGPPAIVLIHDGARPLVTPDLISEVLAALNDPTVHGAAPAVPVTDTIKRATEGGAISATVPRDGLWRAQTPQGFCFAALLAAYDRIDAPAATDDAAVAEMAGLTVRLVSGAADNIKITWPEDLVQARRILGADDETRIGQGMDVHRFGPPGNEKTRVWLCGVALPHERPLLGHSDADVGLHALTDAVLGAIGSGDIGLHFSPTDERWRNASSDRFLAHAVALVQQGGGEIVNLDVTLVCQTPRITPHRTAMVERIAAIASVAVSRVSVKATTTDGLGFTGRGEGVLAQAMAVIRWPS